MHRVLCILATFAAQPLLPAQLLGPAVSTPLTATPGTAVNYTDIASGDMNGDGTPDVVALNFGEVAVLIADGSGAYQPQITTPLVFPVFFATTLKLADANGDGHLDAWVGANFGSGISVFFGDGLGNLTLGPTITGSPVFAIADINGDGAPDVIGSQSTGISVSLNDGAGNFAEPQLALPITSLGVQVLLVEDFDGDDITDILTLAAFGEWVLGRGDGTGGFTAVSQTPIDLLSTAIAADVDGDGAADVLASTPAGNSVLLRNDGTGTFATSESFTTAAFSELAVADIDSDGLIDVIGCNADGITVLLGDGTGGFTATEPTGAPATNDLVVGDFNLDGRVDAIALEAGSNAFVLHGNALPTPAGVTSFGAGTATCAGTIGIWATPEPQPGTPDFRVACSNVPRNRSGVLLIGVNGNPSGFDVPIVGVTLHVGPFSLPSALSSDAGGTASANLPIPPLPFAPTFPLYLQSLWLSDAGAGDTCSPALFELSSSRGLEVVVQ